jgi:hypothetical protein
MTIHDIIDGSEYKLMQFDDEAINRLVSRSSLKKGNV